MSKVKEGLIFDSLMEVSTLEWEELNEVVEQAALTIRTLRRRLRNSGVEDDVTDDDCVEQLEWEKYNTPELEIEFDDEDNGGDLH